jgi:hypothetical protein
MCEPKLTRRPQMMGKFKNLKIPKSGQINQRGVSQVRLSVFLVSLFRSLPLTL